ncbi:MAG: hypothetical protein K2M11_00160 [Paramuribaculum sp.]|nr:hypothetical protein [Paramuribaculum sp.]
METPQERCCTKPYASVAQRREDSAKKQRLRRSRIINSTSFPQAALRLPEASYSDVPTALPSPGTYILIIPLILGVRYAYPQSYCLDALSRRVLTIYPSLTYPFGDGIYGSGASW